jgi:hypothetical protein
VWSTSERCGDLECSASVPLLPVPLPFAISASGCYFDSSLTRLLDCPPQAAGVLLVVRYLLENYDTADRCRGKSSDSATAGGGSGLLH